MSELAIQPLYRFEDVQDYLGVSRSTVERLMRTGELPYAKRGQIVRFRPEDVAAVLDGWMVGESLVEAPESAPASSGDTRSTGVSEKETTRSRGVSRRITPGLPQRRRASGKSLRDRLT